MDRRRRSDFMRAVYAVLEEKEIGPRPKRPTGRLGQAPGGALKLLPFPKDLFPENGSFIQKPAMALRLAPWLAFCFYAWSYAG